MSDRLCLLPDSKLTVGRAWLMTTNTGSSPHWPAKKKKKKVYTLAVSLHHSLRLCIIPRWCRCSKRAKLPPYSATEKYGWMEYISGCWQVDLIIGLGTLGLGWGCLGSQPRDTDLLLPAHQESTISSPVTDYRALLQRWSFITSPWEITSWINMASAKLHMSLKHIPLHVDNA